MKETRQKSDWDCHLACVASLLEIPLDDMPQIHPSMQCEEWHASWQKWCLSKGLISYEIDFTGREEVIHGYTIGLVPSQKVDNRYHSIICLDGKPHFDPLTTNDPYNASDVETHTLLVPLDVAHYKKGDIDNGC